MTVVPIGDGVYRVELEEGRGEIVYVAGPRNNRWAYWNGRVFRANLDARRPAARRGAPLHVAQTLTAPMPATIIKVFVAKGDAVTRGDTIVLLEAMKMELPVRAPADATVTAVRCREGDLVQADAPLVELE